MRHIKSPFGALSRQNHRKAGKSFEKKNPLQKCGILFKRINFVIYSRALIFRRWKMGKKKSGKGGIGSLILKIIKIAVFVFLLANFCWNGKPLWKNIIPTAGDTIEKSEKAIKKEAEKVQKAVKEASKDAEKTAKKAVDETKKAAEDAKDAIKEKASSATEISEEDEKEIEKIIEKELKK